MDNEMGPAPSSEVQLGVRDTGDSTLLSSPSPPRDLPDAPPSPPPNINIFFNITNLKKKKNTKFDF